MNSQATIYSRESFHTNFQTLGRFFFVEQMKFKPDSKTLAL